ncbi:MAG: ATP synthase F1 subunit delta [Acidimicrobiia bacterium]|nr:ATP synthase F1 subunit delta [Acidimicrobiia bacterium]MDH4307057.1 ATP synthase F1 subunit delta [Acidimicrobiia bacterium]MDH5294015.1 ATP synthase F1 subunit delta [Acidimicrobiia bacterium]
MADRVDGYAAAIFELASAEGELSRVEREFGAIARTIDSSTELRDALIDPRLPAERKQAIVDDLVGGRASQLTVNLVSFMVNQGRATELGSVATRLADRAARKGGVDVAEIRSAVPLDDAIVQRLAAALGRAVGRTVEVRTIVDPSVMGGVVARVGDTVIDGSVKSRLQSLRAAMKN